MVCIKKRSYFLIDEKLHFHDIRPISKLSNYIIKIQIKHPVTIIIDFLFSSKPSF